MKRFDNKLAKLKRDYDRSIERLAADVRRKLVIPACRKYALTFAAGMGTYYFRGNYDDADGVTIVDSFISRDLALALGWSDVWRALDVLDADVDSRGSLGTWVADVTAKDLAKKKRRRS